MTHNPSKTRAYIALGSNIAPRHDTIAQAIELLGQHRAVSIAAISQPIETAPIGGPADQGKYINAAAAVETTLDAPQLLHLMQTIENHLGRKRATTWGPRTIDLDLLLFGHEVIDTPALRVPHPLMHARWFVLEPLAEIAPEAVHPKLRKTISQLLAALPAVTTEPQLIAVAGIIGVGKSTLAQKLAQKLHAQFIPEEYDLNPFLAHQLQGDKDAALASELFFLLSRARQLDKRNIYTPWAVADYIFGKNRIFAEMSLNIDQQAIFDQLEATTIKHIITPKLVIYLHDSIANCLDRIKKRGRGFEQNITAPWLAKLDTAYERLLEKWHLSPIIRVDCAAIDIRKDADVQQIVDQLKPTIYKQTP